MLLLNDLFVSLQGEGKSTGIPTVFVRLHGCNVKCSYCDSIQSFSDKRRISVGTLLAQIRRFKLKHICITGGEPLLQDEIYPVVYALVSEGRTVSIETNGCVPIELDYYNRSFNYVMDVKCPSSGVSEHNILSNLANLKEIDEVKFVISDLTDYNYVKDILKKYPTRASLLFSPVFSEDNTHNGKDLAEWLLTDKIFNSRLSLQIHKILLIP